MRVVYHLSLKSEARGISRGPALRTLSLVLLLRGLETAVRKSLSAAPISAAGSAIPSIHADALPPP